MIEFSILREVRRGVSRTATLDFQRAEVPVDWRLANVTPIYKKGRKEDAGKVMEQIILSAIMWHVQDN
ncbi:hypothetical protein QYF61_012577 [Mycteria americana]|uniref:Uncharacterized protein n=1 Tax=Mycteria americana TaxID=33587 RepID=A0AAN7N8Y5_MYCAM|nr:hypothetical protein QYF61_012577 [Mycteria americana]